MVDVMDRYQRVVFNLDDDRKGMDVVDDDKEDSYRIGLVVDELEHFKLAAIPSMFCLQMMLSFSLSLSLMPWSLCMCGEGYTPDYRR